MIFLNLKAVVNVQLVDASLFFMSKKELLKTQAHFLVFNDEHFKMIVSVEES